VKENKRFQVSGIRYQEGTQEVAPEFVRFPYGKYKLAQDRGGGKP
jgi:hypothetical protein